MSVVVQLLLLQQEDEADRLLHLSSQQVSIWSGDLSVIVDYIGIARVNLFQCFCLDYDEEANFVFANFV